MCWHFTKAERVVSGDAIRFAKKPSDTSCTATDTSRINLCIPCEAWENWLTTDDVGRMNLLHLRSTIPLELIGAQRKTIRL